MTNAERSRCDHLLLADRDPLLSGLPLRNLQTRRSTAGCTPSSLRPEPELELASALPAPLLRPGIFGYPGRSVNDVLDLLFLYIFISPVTAETYAAPQEAFSHLNRFIPSRLPCLSSRKKTALCSH